MPSEDVAALAPEVATAQKIVPFDVIEPQTAEAGIVRVVQVAPLSVDVTH